MCKTYCMMSSSRIFYTYLCNLITCDYHCNYIIWCDWYVTAWSHHSNPNPRFKEKKHKLKKKKKKRLKKKLTFRLHISDITLPSRFLLPEKLVGLFFFFFQIIFSIFLSFPFYHIQFLSNFLKYSVMILSP